VPIVAVEPYVAYLIITNELFRCYASIILLKWK
jgi:hypothetical protein